MCAPVPGADGYHHPATEAEVAALIALARSTGKTLRVRGSAHSVPASIHAAGFDGRGRPPGDAVEVMLDRMRAVHIHLDPADPGRAVVEVEAGCHLGRDPYDPTGTSTWANGLNAQLQRAGFALSDLGGITHQTVGGFLATGSSGGSRQVSFHDDLERIRFVDGTGEVHEVWRDPTDPARTDLFDAVAVSMGLLGVITRVWLRVGPTYDVFGTQVTRPTAACGVDLFGDGTGEPSFAELLARAPYARLMWWPQHDFDRMVVWQAARQQPFPGFVPRPYLQLGRAAKVASLAGSLFYALIGNLGDLQALPAKLGPWLVHLEDALDGDPTACERPAGLGWDRAVSIDEVLGWLEQRVLRGLRKSPHVASGGSVARDLFRPLIDGARTASTGFLPDRIAEAITSLVRGLLEGGLSSSLAQVLGAALAREMPYLIDEILDPFVEVGEQTFWDSWLCGLPMDNQMDDQLWPTEFTELWIPIDAAEDAMRALRTHYRAGGDPVAAYAATGSFSCELYAARASKAWLSPSHGTDVLRIDVFWFGLNAGDPRPFYEPFWRLLDPFRFRPHWGKILPGPSPTWRRAWRERLPRAEDFLRLRAQLDPDGVFLTPYWRDHLVDAV